MKDRIKKHKQAAIPPLEGAERYHPDANAGLTSEQAQNRTAAGYINKSTHKTTKSYGEIFAKNILTFFNLLCFIVAGALMYVGSWNNLVFMVIFIANIVIGIVQEIRAKITVEKIKLVTSPTATVIRDGFTKNIAVTDVVLDDIMLLSLGRQVCADAIVADGEVEANESLLTGESVPVKKKIGDLLYAGSYITSGSCRAKVEKIGDYNYSSTLISKAQASKKNKSELLKSIHWIIRVVGIVIIPLAVALFITNWSDTAAKFITVNDISRYEYWTMYERLTKAIPITAGSVIGMIPAGLFLLTSMALAVGVMKLAKKRTLVQDLYSIEMLALSTVICLDKTGTITDGTMTVKEVVPLGSTTTDELGRVVGSILTALQDNNQTSLALADHFGYSHSMPSIAVMPFSSARKYSGASFSNGETYAMGAPEFLLKKIDAKLEHIIRGYAEKGLRVLAVARSKGTISGEGLPGTPEAIAIIAIEDQIRKNAAETLAWFVENGVDVKIISGDNAMTVSEISRRVGVPNADKFISLDGLSEMEVIDAATKYTVFGRVSPDQKCTLVKALKSAGHKVAMTGDGVNDILALKEADCSIAMASGSEAARNVSQVVLLDSDFSSMPAIVGEGRRVVNNVSKSSALFLMKTFMTIFLTVFCISTKTKYPFVPANTLLFEMLIIGLPSFVLALQPNTEKIRGHFMTKLIARALPAGALLVVCILGCYLYDQVFVRIWEIRGGFANGSFSTFCAITVLFVGIIILYRICQPIDTIRLWLITAIAIAICIAVFVLPGSWFKFDKDFSVIDWIMMVVIVQFAYTLTSFAMMLNNGAREMAKRLPIKPKSDESDDKKTKT